MTSIDLELTGIAHGGHALGRHEGLVIFVPYGVPGDRVRVRITEDRGSFAFAELLQLLQPSSHRVEAPCVHFGPGRCGGCQWQHIDYPFQLTLKQGIVQDQLERIGRLRRVEVQPTLAAAPQWGAVHRLGFETLPGEPLGLALRGQQRDHLEAITRCDVLAPVLSELKNELALSTPEIQRVTLAAGSQPDDRMIIIETSDDLAPGFAVDFPVSVNLLLSDNEPVNLLGSAQVHYELLGRSFRVTAGSYFRPAAGGVALLVSEAIRLLNPAAEETILDLYSGVGVFTAFIAERAGLVMSVESYPPAVTDADENLADLENIELVEGSVEAVLADIGLGVDGVLLDPPGSGLSRDALAALRELRAARIVYVSSDPASLARDAAQLLQAGYQLDRVQPFDLAPQTPYVTTIARFLRR